MPKDDLVDALGTPPAPKAAFADWLSHQTPQRRAALNEAAVNSKWTSYALMQLLKRYKAPCSMDAVKKWRRELGYEE